MAGKKGNIQIAKDSHIIVRIPLDVKAELEKRSSKNYRSVNGQILYLIERFLKGDNGDQ